MYAVASFFICDSGAGENSIIFPNLLSVDFIPKTMYWFLFCQGDLVLTREGAVPQGAEPPVALAPWQRQQVLPLLHDEPCRAVRLEEPVVDPNFQMVGLRASYDILPHDVYQMAGKGYELLYWDSCTKFCGVCGSPMEMHTDISKRCTNCGKEVWPQLATAIIVAITRGDEILLVQSKNFKRDYMGLVAGFVETGETLEACVHREVMEETRITIKNLRYVESQAWPYPSGLMVGFFAEYAGGELHLQRSELRKGGWFHHDHLPEIPGKVSLARRLIDRWLATFEKNEAEE